VPVPRWTVHGFAVAWTVSRMAPKLTWGLPKGVGGEMATLEGGGAVGAVPSAMGSSWGSGGIVGNSENLLFPWLSLVGKVTRSHMFTPRRGHGTMQLH
jgi:hypothetical protein